MSLVSLLAAELDKQRRLIGSLRSRHHAMRVSRDAWREKAKQRRERIVWLERRLERFES